MSWSPMIHKNHSYIGFVSPSVNPVIVMVTMVTGSLLWNLTLLHSLLQICRMINLHAIQCWISVNCMNLDSISGSRIFLWFWKCLRNLKENFLRQDENFQIFSEMFRISKKKSYKGKRWFSCNVHLSDIGIRPSQAM